jgi:hypothetical protein
MAKNLKPCITIINIDGKEARLTYDQMREHLFNNPELWQEGKAERRKIGGKKKEAKEGPLAQAAPNSPEGIAARIRNKKQRGALSAIDFGISVTIYNGALEFMASQVEKETKLGNAIANTIKWIDDKMKGEKWNKEAFEKAFKGSPEVKLVTEVPIGKPIKKTETDLLVRARPNDILNNLNRYSLKELVTLLSQHDKEGDYWQYLDTEEFPNKSEALAQARKDVARIFEDFDLFELQQRQNWMDLTQTEEAASPFAITEASKKKIEKAKAKELTRQEVELISEEKRMGTKIVPGLKFENIEGQKFEVVDVNRSTGDVTFKNVSDYEGYWRGTNTTNPMRNNYFDYLFYQVSETTSPEQKLKQAIDEWKAENKKLGISVNWEKLAETDKKLIKALFNYIKEKIAQGKYSFDDFVREYGNKIKNFEAQKGKWQGLYNKAAKEAETEKPVTPTEEKKEEGRKAVRELPEGEEGETEKPVLGRAFRGTTDEALAEKLAKMGLYRKPASLEEAEKVGAETVALLGVDKAIELGAKGDVSNGLVRMGIFKAVLADLKKQRNNLVVKEGAQGQEEYIKALDEINDKRAEAMAAFSPSLTSAGQVLRGFQDIIRDEEFEFDYNSRKTKFKDLFGDEAYTKEVDDKFKEYDIKLKEAAQKRKELEDKIAELEAQSVVDDIQNQAKEKKSTSFFKQAAERVRKLKLSRPGIFSTATPASLAWDASIEAVALVLDASGTLEEAIVAGIGKLEQTEWYKSLTDSKKRNAEDELRKYVKDGYILKATVDDSGVIQVPTGLLRSYVTSGINDVQAIIDDMLSYLKEADSEITASDVRTAILEAGKKEAPTQNQITQSVNDLKSMIRMLGQLEKIRAGERITKNEGKKRQMRDAVANLKKLIEQKHLEVFGTKPGALTDEQRLVNLKKNAQQRIADMRAMKPRPEPRQKVKWDAEMEAIANEEYRVKEKWDEEFSKARIAQLSAWQKIGRGAYLGVNFSKTIMTGMTDLGILLIQGATLPFRSASVTKQAIANMAKVILSHDEFVKQQRTINESDLYRIARKSGLDMPQVSGMEIDKLEESSLGAAGELIGDALLLPFKYVPKAGPKMYEWAKKHINVPRVLNRMQTSYLNTLRYGAFSLSARNLMQKGITFQDNPQAYKDVAEAINTMSGRTKLGAENSPAIMRALNLMFYSPKNAASVAKLYTPLVLIEIGSKRADASGWMGMSEAQQTMIRTMAGATAIPAALYLILKALTGWDEEDEEKKKRAGNITLDIENPNSSAFMKIRIGNQLFDPWGGRAQIITLQSRLWIHWWGSGRGYKDPYTGIEKKLSEVQRFKHPVGLVQEYAKGKLSPYARALLTLGTSQEVKGKKWYVRQPTDGGPEFNAWDPIKESYTNITLESMADLYGNQPLTISEIMTLFLIAGGGVTTLNNQDDRSLISKIREKTAPEEDEKRKFAKNFGSYIKEGNIEGAEGVYDEAVGVTGKEKSKTEVVKKRREQADDFFNSAKKDGIAPRYSIDKEDRKKVFDLLYKNKPIPPNTKKDKKELYERMNSFTPEEKAAIMHDYDMEYQELMNIAKGLDALNKTPMKYERKAKAVDWVKEYRKAKGLK